MADLHAAKDIIKALPKGIQLETTQRVSDKLATDQAAQAEVAINQGVIDVINATPGMTIEDGNQLVTWQEKRETGRPEGP